MFFPICKNNIYSCGFHGVLAKYSFLFVRTTFIVVGFMGFGKVFFPICKNNIYSCGFHGFLKHVGSVTIRESVSQKDINELFSMFSFISQLKSPIMIILS